MDDIIDYIPVAGDIYRAAKFGWKLGSIANDLMYGHNQLLQRAYNYLQASIKSESIRDTKRNAEYALQLLKKCDDSKKYQMAYKYTMQSQCHYLLACCNMTLDEGSVKSEFRKAIWKLRELSWIEVTWFTTNADTIRELQAEGEDYKMQIIEAKREWTQQDKKRHPWKYMRWWIISVIFIIFIIFFMYA